MMLAKHLLPRTHRRWWSVTAWAAATPILFAVAGPLAASDAAPAKDAAPVVQKSAHPGVGEMVVVPASRQSVLRATVGTDGKLTFERRPAQAAAADATAPAR